jgi:hypothetical protein
LTEETQDSEPTFDDQVASNATPQDGLSANPAQRGGVAVSTQALTTAEFFAAGGCSTRGISAVFAFCRVGVNVSMDFERKTQAASFIVNNHEGSITVSTFTSGSRTNSFDLGPEQMLNLQMRGPRNIFGTTLSRTFHLSTSSDDFSPYDASGFWFNF